MSSICCLEQVIEQVECLVKKGWIFQQERGHVVREARRHIKRCGLEVRWVRMQWPDQEPAEPPAGKTFSQGR